MRRRALVGTALSLALLAAGCGTAVSPGAASRENSNATRHDTTRDVQDSATPADHEGSGTHEEMAGMDMGGSQAADGPTGTAKMICSEEIQDAVRRTFALSSPPASTETWAKSERLYGCTYQLPGGTLKMSVQDALDPAPGRSYFEGLRSTLRGAQALRGMVNLGFPSFETAGGQVVFLKDGKTLLVDAAALSGKGLPRGYTRSEAAYAIAAAVIACWTE